MRPTPAAKPKAKHKQPTADAINAALSALVSTPPATPATGASLVAQHIDLIVAAKSAGHSIAAIINTLHSIGCTKITARHIGDALKAHRPLVVHQQDEQQSMAQHHTG